MKGKKKLRRWLKNTLTTPAFWLGVGVTAVGAVVMVLLTKCFVVLGFLLCVLVVAVLWYLRCLPRASLDDDAAEPSAAGPGRERPTL